MLHIKIARNLATQSSQLSYARSFLILVSFNCTLLPMSCDQYHFYADKKICLKRLLLRIVNCYRLRLHSSHHKVQRQFRRRATFSTVGDRSHSVWWLLEVFCWLTATTLKSYHHGDDWRNEMQWRESGHFTTSNLWENSKI